jgi:hypothetical protein
MPQKQSTSRASTIAGRYMRLKEADILAMLQQEQNLASLVRNIRTLAASVVSQDERRGK